MVLVLLFGLILVSKLYLVQIRSGESFSSKANRQYATPNQTLFDRGIIYFSGRDGIPSAAATLKDGYTLVMIPRTLKDAGDAYMKLSKLITLDKDTFFIKAAKINDPHEELAKHVDKDVGLAIDALKIPGIAVYADRWRFYPGGSSASHVIGFTGFSNNNIIAGRYGLERTYESTLTKETKSLYVNFFAEIFAGLNKTILQGKPEGDITTTIEPTVQSYAEKTIKKIGDTWKSEVTGIIIIDPVTGEIKTMASYPAFNPNSFQSEKDVSIFTNPMVENVYEMGSIVKPLTIAAAIDVGAITAATTYVDNGFLILDGKKISNFDGVGRGRINMQVVLNESLNTGAAFAESKMGNETFSQYMYDFGIGELTGIDLPNEAKGIVNNLKSPRDIEHATASYGQGIAMTPVNTVRALSALANGGNIMQPHVVKDISYTLGYTKKIEPLVQKNVLKKTTSEEISRMLVQAVDTALVGGKLKIQHYSIAAKTGTAQIADPHGGYYSDRVLHSFFGYFPAYNPKFLVFIFTKSPHGAAFAGETLATPFIDITKFLINYYQIPPDR